MQTCPMVSMHGPVLPCLPAFPQVKPSRHNCIAPNGSGKTTTLKALLGLVNADGGKMRVFDRPAPHALSEVVHRLGAIVESPAFFGNFTGRRTLSLLATAGGVDERRVDEVLEVVGLRDRG